MGPRRVEIVLHAFGGTLRLFYEEGGAMAILRIEHRTRDFDAWKRAFEGDPLGREESGVRRYRVARRTDDPNYATVDLEFETRDEAEAFGERLRDLWGRVQSDLGLEDPQARVLEVVEDR